MLKKGHIQSLKPNAGMCDNLHAACKPYAGLCDTLHATSKPYAGLCAMIRETLKACFIHVLKI